MHIILLNKRTISCPVAEARAHAAPSAAASVTDMCKPLIDNVRGGLGRKLMTVAAESGMRLWENQTEGNRQGKQRAGGASAGGELKQTEGNREGKQRAQPTVAYQRTLLRECNNGRDERVTRLDVADLRQQMEAQMAANARHIAVPRQGIHFSNRT